LRIIHVLSKLRTQGYSYHCKFPHLNGWHKEDPVCHHYRDWLELRFHLWPRLDTYIAEQTDTADFSQTLMARQRLCYSTLSTYIYPWYIWTVPTSIQPVTNSVMDKKDASNCRVDEAEVGIHAKLLTITQHSKSSEL